MVRNNLEREIGRRELDYGEHVVRITVELVHDWFYRAMNAGEESGVFRRVTVEALFDDEAEVENSNAVYLEAEPRPGITDALAALVTEQSATERWLARNAPLIPSVEAQVEEAVRPVFDELDEIYEFTTVEYDIDVEASVHRVKHDVSWVDIEDEVDRLCAEIDGMATS